LLVIERQQVVAVIAAL